MSAHSPVATVRRWRRLIGVGVTGLGAVLLLTGGLSAAAGAQVLTVPGFTALWSPA